MMFSAQLNFTGVAILVSTVWVFLFVLTVLMLIVLISAYVSYKKGRDSLPYADCIKTALLFSIVAIFVHPASIVSFYYYYKALPAGVSYHRWFWYLLVPFVIAVVYMCIVIYIMSNAYVLYPPSDFSNVYHGDMMSITTHLKVRGLGENHKAYNQATD